MLLFLCHEPTAQNEKDGMVQRVRWVDDQFSGIRRVILHVWLKGGWKRERHVRNQFLTVEKVNFFLHFPRIIWLALQSEVIYVHSCYNALRALPIYLLKRHIITDMHGVVPEESRFEGHLVLSLLLALVERVVIRRSKALVFVTDAMREHFARKYQEPHRWESYVIPILTDLQVQGHQPRDPGLVIYAGGTQPWQNVDMMIDVAIKIRDQFHYLFLTGQRERFVQRLPNIGLDGVRVDSVSKSQVFDCYQRATFGFVLRKDSVINRVACPTKLVEYLQAGVIPIVETPHIGDFEAAGYRYILRTDFVKGRIPDSRELEAMRDRNQRVITELRNAGNVELERLMTDLTQFYKREES